MKVVRIDGLQSLKTWRDSQNPLRSLSMPRAVSLLENAQRGIFADLMWLYEVGIEEYDADLSVLIERTSAAILDMEFKVAQVRDDVRGFDQSLADEQEEFLRGVYEGIPDLYESLAHLTSARFRGFAHVTPWYKDSSRLAIESLHPLMQWNMVRDGYRGGWAFNEKAANVGYDQLPASARLDSADYLVYARRRPVNKIALVKYVRESTSEKDWDAYVEIFGLPSVFIIAPEGLDEIKLAEFKDAAAEAARGGNGAFPNGTTIQSPNEARQSQPFQPRLEWLQKKLILAGTGGLLSVLSAPDSGTLAGSVHAQAFAQIGRAEARKISEVIQAQLDRQLLQRQFPGKQALAYFSLQPAKERNVEGFVNNVAKLATAGFYADQAQVEEETGLRIALFQPPAAALQTPATGSARASRLATPADRAQAAILDAATVAFRDATAKELQPLADELYQLLLVEEPAAFMAAARSLSGRMPGILARCTDVSSSSEALFEAFGTALANGLAEGAEARPIPKKGKGRKRP
jgi:phage gp29-like protein